MSELIKQLTKVLVDGDLAVDNLIDIDSESESIFKRFPFMSSGEKREAIKRYVYLKEQRHIWIGQITLVKEFLSNTLNELKSLDDGFIEKFVESRKLKKLNKMLENEFVVDNGKGQIAQAVFHETMDKIMTSSDTAILNVIDEKVNEAIIADIKDIQAEKASKATK